MKNEIKSAGSFTFDPKNGQIQGPADYMKEKFQDRMEAIYAGRDHVFNYGSMDGRDVVPMVLVSLQTDYAAFQGMKSFGRSLASQEIKS